MNLYIYSYNNYYNRQVKKAGDRIEDYAPWKHLENPLTGVYGFTPGDGVNTKQLIGTSAMMYDGKGDYLIAHNPDTDEIDSRWFIIDVNRTRNGQWELTLHRDLVVDYYDTIVKSPMFIEKGILADSDPFIYNSENMTFNQIKKSETLLKDETDCAWIVGYMSSKPFNDGQGDQDKISSEIKYHLPVNKSYSSLSNFELYQYSNKAPASEKEPLISNPTDIVSCVWFSHGMKNSLYYGRKYAFNNKGSQNTGILGQSGYSQEIPYNWLITGDFDENYQCPPNAGSSMIWQNSLVSNGSYPSTILSYLKKGFSTSNAYSKINTYLLDQVSSVSLETINAYKDWTIYVEDTHEYYNVQINNIGISRTEILPNYNSNLWLAMKEGYDATVSDYNSDPYYSSDPTWADFTGITAEPNSYSFSVNFQAAQYEVVLTKIATPSYSYKVEIDNNRYHLNDAPYDMFAIPYSDDLIINKSNAFYVQANKELAFQTALALGRDYMGAGYIYDIQLLPYCPFRSCIKSDGTFDIDTVSYYDIEALEGDQSYGNGEVVGVILFGTQSNFTFNINKTLTLENKKIQSSCDSWRLCSPNYNGLFEFNVAKNNGIQYFNIDCTYKPYNPYIHINPDFQNLYGYDANDMRGLVCGGDFSLPQVTDSWRTYELNNKNYQNIFDRNIQSMELKNNIQAEKDIFNAVAGTVMGGAAGAATGAAAGPWGAIAGGIVGTAASAVGGIMDVSINEILRNDALDLTKDQFGYNLGNIQALPYSLAKTSAFTANNKLFPFIEYYTCTDSEKRALANKIAWNGMTVMRIGIMSDFIGNTWNYENITSKGYIKGKLIRLEFVEEGIDEPHKQNIHSEDFHVVNAIADELNKGVYIE